jgi:hypothetical protein
MRVKGFCVSFAVWMWSKTISVSKRSACFWKRSIRSGPCTPVGVGRPVVDLGGGHQLAALGQAGDEQGLEVGAGGVDGGGIAGRAGAEDEQAAMAGRPAPAL